MAQDGSTCGRSKPSSVTLCFGQIAGFARVDAGRPWSNSDTCSGVYLAYTRRIPGEYPGVRPATNCPLNPPGRRTSRVSRETVVVALPLDRGRSKWFFRAKVCKRLQTCRGRRCPWRSRSTGVAPESGRSRKWASRCRHVAGPYV